jgi:hypothetical protein
MQVRKTVAFVGLTVGSIALSAGTAFAHDCFNPNKPAGAGVNYEITGFGPTGPIFVQVGPGQGIGGFATLDGTDIHTMGNSGDAVEVAGGPGSQTEDHACDGHGIDYAEAC